VCNIFVHNNKQVNFMTRIQLINMIDSKLKIWALFCKRHEEAKFCKWIVSLSTEFSLNILGSGELCYQNSL